MSNPHVGTEYESAWDQGYSYGYYYPDDTDPVPPTPYAEDMADVYRQGAYAGRQAVGEAQATGGMSGDAGGGGYSTAGSEPTSSEQGPVTIPEVTVEGDPNRPIDPNSADDAYAVGYNAGYHGELSDDSQFADAVKSWYQKGYNEGGGLHRTEPSEHSGAAEVAHGVGEVAVPTAIDHWVLHGLLKGAPWADLIVRAVSPGGDTALHPPDAYMAVCHLNSHGLSGDAVFDGGAWHGSPTLDLSGAQSELTDHESNWDHGGSAHIWVFDKDDEWTMDITLDPG